MSKRVKGNFRRAGVHTPAPEAPAGMGWYGKLGLLLLTVLLLSLSFAPFAQFYLAWVGLVPWLMLVRSTGSQRAAFLWGWAAGVVFFVANMWWLAYVTGPGMVALMVVLGLYWGAAAVVIRGAGLLAERWLSGGVSGWWSNENTGDAASTPPLHNPTAPPLLTVLLVPTVWVALEWLRGTWPLNGLPWLFLGHGQTPVLAMCQVADALGVYGISFWVVAVNTLAALFVIDRFKTRRLVPAAAVVGSLLLLVLGYGLWRMSQTDALSPGPVVMVVQPNYPQSNTGEKGASQVELVNYHVSRTEAALRERGAGVDMVVWSETMMPYINREARDALRGSEAGEFLEQVHEILGDLAREYRTALVTGGIFAGEWSMREDEPFPADRRNTAYFYDRAGRLSDDPADRYDKIHIVPFGEYVPFKHSFPLLHGIIMSLSPYPDEYFLTAGEEEAMNVFRLSAHEGATTLPTTAPASAPVTSVTASSGATWRFVTPICFEDIDPLLVSKMFRHRGAVPGDGRKAADFIVNITNDGWFKANQMPQHLQAARFRSIENRAPTARSVNTGISGFIDSFGRVYGLVPAGTEGTSVQRLQLDSRVTLYTRWGDVFALLCAALTAALAGASVVRWWKWRRLSGD